MNQGLVPYQSCINDIIIMISVMNKTKLKVE